jgi:site-specific recombinase XerD
MVEWFLFYHPLRGLTMFAQLFTQPDALARHQSGPLLEERCRFLAHHADRGLSWSTLRCQANALLRINEVFGLVRPLGESISRDEVRQKAISQNATFPSIAIRWLRFLGRLKEEVVPVNPYAKEIQAFADYMQREKCLADSTVKSRCQFLQRFFSQFQVPWNSLGKVTAAHIDEALLGMVNQRCYARGSVRTWAHHLRSFLRYAATRRWCEKKLADVIRSPRTFTQVSLPRGPSWDDVRRLLAMTEGNRPVDIRDRAILMLLSIYALRSGEVRRLVLSDFCWEHELISVTCPKTRRTRTYPLIRPAGDAVLRYLQEVRPKSNRREVFLTMRRPFMPLGAGVGDIVSSRLRRLSLCLPHYGPHALRHACATHLLAEGLSLKEIGDHLGHRAPDTTQIYAKVDLASLRQVANFDLGGLL